jgi:SAM-dependent methyltransferase
MWDIRRDVVTTRADPGRNDQDMTAHVSTIAPSSKKNTRHATLARLVLDPAHLEALCREPRALQPLIDYLRATGYTLPELARIVDDSDPASFIINAGRCAFLYDDELRDHASPVALLARLFLLGGRIEAAQYRAAVPANIRDLLERLAVVREHEGNVTAEVAIVELDASYLISDKLFDNRDGMIEVHADPSAVWPMSEWSLNLYRRLATDPRWTRMLDVGCGTGCVSLLSRRRYAELSGFDLNPRAVAFANLNATLAAAAVQYTVADCLAYTAAAPFDHIVFAAPAGPSVGGEGAMVSYGGRLGHELALRFMSERAAALLAPGGCCQTWSIFAVQQAFGSVKELVERSLPSGRFTTTVDEIRSGGLYVSREHIERGKVPPGCHYAQGDAAVELLRWLRANDVVEVVSAVVTLRDILEGG